MSVALAAWCVGCDLIARKPYAIASMYEDGLGVPKNYVEAMKWYCRATQNGIEAALSPLGNLSSRMSIEISKVCPIGNPP
jgi:hypothetical protein